MAELEEEKIFKDPPEKKPRIGEDAAKDIFKGWLDYYDIKFSHIVNDQGREGAETLENKIVCAIQDEKIETNLSTDPNEGFQIIQHTRPGKTITYNEYGFKAARESAKQKDSASAQIALLASLSGLGMPNFDNKKWFSGPDLKLAEYISILFLL
ncbi:MAG: hypothetical protein GWP06_00320 [Actinobacteria bacterium]|nr:hypothetical protein [Actinomycetota bacterium]